MRRNVHFSTLAPHTNSTCQIKLSDESSILTNQNETDPSKGNMIKSLKKFVLNNGDNINGQIRFRHNKAVKR